MLVGENVCRSCFAVLVTSYDSVIIYFDLFALTVPIYLSIKQMDLSFMHCRTKNGFLRMKATNVSLMMMMRNVH